MSGVAQIVRNGVAIAANTGDAVLKGDVVQTGSGGSLSIIFTDSTTFNLSSDARMVINEFVYDPNGSANASLINLVQGTIGFVAGQVAKTGDMKVKTPVATMGIRGTAVVVDISANDGVTKFSVVFEQITQTSGSFELRDNLTGQLLGTVSNTSVGWVVRPVSPTEVFAQQLTKSAEEIQKELAIIAQVFQHQSIGQQLLNLTDPNQTKTASVFTQFVVSDRIGIHPGDPLGKTITYTVNFSGIPDPVPNPHANDLTFVNHPPIARPDGQAQADFVEVKEAGVGPGNTPDSGTPVATGNLLANDEDPDHDPIMLVSITAVSTRLHALSLSVDSSGQFTYTLDNNDPEVQALALGETIKDIYSYTIRDQFGATATAELTVTIIGTNDQPVIDTANTTATAEFSENAATLLCEEGPPPPVLHSAEGSIAFKDVDLSDTHHLESTPPAPTFEWSSGTLSDGTLAMLGGSALFELTLVDTEGTGAGKVDWTFAIGDSALDFLADGETLTVTYAVVITDINGASITQDIVITITGSNDIPTIDATSGVVSETEDGVSLSGLVNFTDLDLNDRPFITAAYDSYTYTDAAGCSLSLTPDQIAALTPALTLTPSGDNRNNGSAEWSYQVPDSAVDFLAAGQTLTLTYVATVDDHDDDDDSNDGIVSQSFTITIYGTNDAPVTKPDNAGPVHITSVDSDYNQLLDAYAPGYGKANFSPDGTKITFAANHETSPGNTNVDIFVKDLQTGELTLLTPGTDSGSSGPVFSPDGTKVMFASRATTLVAGDNNNRQDIFIKDLDSGSVQRVVAGDGDSFAASFSSDGSKIVFISLASNLVAGDTNGGSDVFVKDLDSGIITRVSTSAGGAQADNDFAHTSTMAVFSPDGTKVAFDSQATNLVPGDTNSASDIFVKDLDTGAITRVSVNAAGVEGNGPSVESIMFSPDGSKIMFWSGASNLAPGFGGGATYIKDLTTDEVTGIHGSQGVFSPDGTKVATTVFTGTMLQIVVTDLATGEELVVSTDNDGNAANGDSVYPVFGPEGGSIAFASAATNLSEGDGNNAYDIFVKDIGGGGRLVNIDEDPTSNPGQTIADIVAGKFSDVDTGASIVGVAVASNTADSDAEGS